MRQFRSGRTLPPLILWAFLTIGAIILLQGSLWVWPLLLLGPVAVVLHAIRCALQRVTVDPDRGLILPSGRLVPWKVVRRVRARPAPFQKIPDPELPEDVGDAIFAVVTAKTLWALAYCLVFPALAVLSPWHGKVSIDLADGTSIVYHDLHDEELFVRVARIGLSGHAKRAERIAAAYAREA
jgi:hypothetical protein